MEQKTYYPPGFEHFKTYLACARNLAAQLFHDGMSEEEVLRYCSGFAQYEEECKTTWKQQFINKLRKMDFAPETIAHQLRKNILNDELPPQICCENIKRYRRKYSENLKENPLQRQHLNRLDRILNMYLKKVEEFNIYGYHNYVHKTHNTELEHILRTFAPAARRFAQSLLRHGKNIVEICQQCQDFSSLEISLCSNWKRELKADLKELRLDVESYAYQLYRRICNDTVTPERAFNKAQKRLETLQRHNLPRSRQLQNMLALLQKYIKRVERYQTYSLRYLQEQNIEGLKNELEQQRITEENEWEDMEFQLQNIKHLQQYQYRKRPVSEEMLKTALDTRFSDDLKVFQNQIEVINNDCVVDNDHKLIVKQLKYIFIRHILVHNKKVSADLIQFLLKDNWISEETFELLKESYPTIKKAGMLALVYSPVHKMYLAIADPQRPNLPPPLQYIVELDEFYSK